MPEHLLIGLTLILVLGIAARWIAWRLHLPSILLLLLSGITVGPLTGLLNPDEVFGDLLLPLVSMSVAVILFEGGLSLSLTDLREIGSIVRNLVTLGVLVTWVITTGAAYLILGFDFALALLLGAILVVTGPTVVIPLLRHVRPKGQIGSIVKWEGILPGFPFWPSWSVYDSRLPAAMQRFSHCCQVRYSFRCRSGLRMLADHGVPAKPEGPLATPLPRRPSATRVRWLFRAVDVTLRAQVAPKSAAACRRTTSGSDAPPQAATNNIARASRAVRPS